MKTADWTMEVTIHGSFKFGGSLKKYYKYLIETYPKVEFHLDGLLIKAVATGLKSFIEFCENEME